MIDGRLGSSVRPELGARQLPSETRAASSRRLRSAAFQVPNRQRLSYRQWPARLFAGNQVARTAQERLQREVTAVPGRHTAGTQTHRTARGAEEQRIWAANAENIQQGRLGHQFHSVRVRLIPTHLYTTLPNYTNWWHGSPKLVST